MKWTFVFTPQNCREVFFPEKKFVKLIHEVTLNILLYFFSPAHAQNLIIFFFESYQYVKTQKSFSLKKIVKLFMKLVHKMFCINFFRNFRKSWFLDLFVTCFRFSDAEVLRKYSFVPVVAYTYTGGGKSTSRNATTYTWPNMYQWWQVVVVVVSGGISTYRFLIWKKDTR